MAKPWNKLSDSEKIERLRRELDDLIARFDAAGGAFDDLYARVKSLEERAPGKPAKKP